MQESAHHVQKDSHVRRVPEASRNPHKNAQKVMWVMKPGEVTMEIIVLGQRLHFAYESALRGCLLRHVGLLFDNMVFRLAHSSRNVTNIRNVKHQVFG